MALAGYCRSCGQYVWLDAQWGCVNGHPCAEISNWYDPQNGTPVTPYWLQPAVAAATAPSAVVPGPSPQPAPNPEPSPWPAPTPSPAPEPSPLPEPIPAPTPEPAPWPAPEPAPGPELEPLPQTGIDMADDRLGLLGDVLATLVQYPGYSAQYGNQVGDVTW